MPSQKFIVCVSVLLIALAGCSRQQSDWQKTREANSTEAYEQFVKKYPSGEFTAQAQARLKDLYEERDWQKARDTDTLEAYQAFLKQYPDGKNTEEARIRVENFTLAQTPTGGTAAGAAQSGDTAVDGSGASAGGVGASGGSMGAAGGAGAGHGVAPGSSAATGSNAGASTSAMNAEPPGTPTTSPKAHKSHPASAAESEPAVRASHGKYAVQLGAFKSGAEAADKHWEKLKHEYPKLFAQLSSKVVPKKTTSGTLYRLQAVGMSEEHAARVCKVLKAKSQPCAIVRPHS